MRPPRPRPPRRSGIGRGRPPPGDEGESALVEPDRPKPLEGGAAAPLDLKEELG